MRKRDRRTTVAGDRVRHRENDERTRRMFELPAAGAASAGEPHAANKPDAALDQLSSLAQLHAHPPPLQNPERLMAGMSPARCWTT